MRSVGNFDFGHLGAYCAELGKCRFVSGLEDRVCVGLLRAFDRRFLEVDAFEQKRLLSAGHRVCSFAAGCRVCLYGGSHVVRQA